MALAPTDFARRTFVYRDLVALGAEFAEVNGCAAAMALEANVESEVEQARRLAICDLSALPRSGYKGWNAGEWVRGLGIELGEASNRTYDQADGSRVPRLAPGEVLILGDLSGKAPLMDKLTAAWSMESAVGAYPVPRADTNCWFVVTGEQAGAMFAKVCGVDLRAEHFAGDAVAQTSLARLNSIIVRGDLGECHALHVLSDSAAASYMWRCLLDAMEEFGGRPVGLSAIRKLAGIPGRRPPGPSKA